MTIRLGGPPEASDRKEESNVSTRRVLHRKADDSTRKGRDWLTDAKKPELAATEHTRQLK